MSREHESNIEIETRPLTSHSTRAGGRSYVQISVYLELLYGAAKRPGCKRNAERKWDEFTRLVEEGILRCFIPAL